MRTVLKSPLTMVERIASWLKKHGELVTANSNNACYTWNNIDTSISAQYQFGKLYDITIDKTTTLIVEGTDIICIEGEPKKLLKAYELCENAKDTLGEVVTE